MSRIETFFITLFYALCLVALYRDSAYPMFGYMGFRYFESSISSILLTSVTVSFISMFLPRTITKPSDMFCWLTFVIVIVPTFVMPQLVTVSLPTEQLWLVLSVIGVCFVSTTLLTTIDVNFHGTVVISHRLKLIFSLVFLLTLLAFVYQSYGFSLARLLDIRNFTDLYDIRHAYRAQGSEASSIAKYGITLLANVLIPFLFTLALHNKRYFWCVAAFVLQLSIFTISGHKSFLLSLFMAIAVYIIVTRRNSGLLFYRLVFLLLVSSALLFYVADFHWLTTLIVRRVLMVPGMLSGYYFEFYSANEFAYYGQSFLKNIVDTAYAKPPAFVIGFEYFNNPETSANAHFYADAFANFGLWGIFLVTIIINIMLLVLNGIVKTGFQNAMIAVLTISFFSLSQTSLNTALITHGFLLASLLALCIKIFSGYSKNTVVS